MQTTSTQPALALQPAGSLSGKLQNFAATIPGKVILGLAATVVVAISAHLSFPLPFTHVPLTLQPLAVLGVGLAFGPLGGLLVMLTYLAEGAAGLPVFSPYGPGGTLQLFGFTGGYLMADPLVAALAGGLAQLLMNPALRGRIRPFAAATIACTAAVILLYTCGMAWLMSLQHLSVRAAMIQAVVPFAPGEVVKILAAAGVYSALVRRPTA